MFSLRWDVILTRDEANTVQTILAKMKRVAEKLERMAKMIVKLRGRYMYKEDK